MSSAIDLQISVLLMQHDRGREIRKKSILDFKFKGFDSFSVCERFCLGMDLSVNIDKIEFFYEIHEKISIVCTAFRGWPQDKRRADKMIYSTQLGFTRYVS